MFFSPLHPVAVEKAPFSLRNGVFLTANKAEAPNRRRNTQAKCQSMYFGAFHLKTVSLSPLLPFAVEKAPLSLENVFVNRHPREANSTCKAK